MAAPDRQVAPGPEDRHAPHGPEDRHVPRGPEDRHVVVGRVARAHGVRGEVSVDVRTDDPERRFRPGTLLSTQPASAGPLRIDGVRPHGERLLVQFDGITERDRAEALRGVRLLVDADAEPLPADPDAFYDHELAGLAVRTTDGEAVGVVRDVLHLPSQDLLAVGRPDGAEVLVPFVRAIVPVVDVPGGELVLDPPPGLLEAPDDAASEHAPG